MVYSNNGLTWTTLTTKHRETGSVDTMRSKEKTVNKCAHIPGPSSHTEKLIVIIIKIMINIELWIVNQYFAG